MRLLTDYAYEGVRRIVFDSGATFVPVCESCGRFVRADKTIRFRESGEGPPVDEPNATCAKCGRVQMLFEGFIEPFEAAPTEEGK